MGIFDRLRKQVKSHSALGPAERDSALGLIDELEVRQEKVDQATLELSVANVQLRDITIREVANQRHETVLVDRLGAMLGEFGLITLSDDGHFLRVYEGTVVEADGTVVDLGPTVLVLDDGTELPRGATTYFSRAWQRDPYVQRMLTENLALRSRLASGDLEIQYLDVEVGVDGNVGLFRYKLNADALELRL